jgi:hypothetical protein
MNAFHPDYVKTHLPQFLTALKIDDRQLQAGATLSKHVTEKRKTVPSHGFIPGISKEEKLAKIDLAPRDFHVFNKAGTGNIKPKGKKK